MHRYLAIVALFAVSAPAHAGELAAYEAGSIRLGSIRGSPTTPSRTVASES